MKWLTLSGRFAPSSPEGRAFDKTANSAGNAKASHFGGRWQRVSADGEGEDAEGRK